MTLPVLGRRLPAVTVTAKVGSVTGVEASSLSRPVNARVDASTIAVRLEHGRG